MRVVFRDPPSAKVVHWYLGTCLASIFGLQPSKRGPFRSRVSKQKRQDKNMFVWINSWWFQRIWNILVKLPRVGMNIKYIWNHDLNNCPTSHLFFTTFGSLRSILVGENLDNLLTVFWGVFPRKKKRKTPNPTMPHCTCRVKPWQRMKLHGLVKNRAFHTRFSILMGRQSSKHQPFKGSQNKNIKNQVAYLAAHGTDRN